MSDFFQHDAVATLHRLGAGATEKLEARLREFSAINPVALVLPCHAEELGTPALDKIVSELRGVKYLGEIVVGLDGADSAACQRARQLFGALPQNPVVVWNDGPGMNALLRRLAGAGLDAGPGGKGRNLWLCFGYVLAGGRSRVIAAHDCDIHTYSRDLLARLCYPVTHPEFGFGFCKGFSARFTGRLNGRVMRLLFTPLIRSLQSVLGAREFLTFLDGFRYPLSGEVSLNVDVARQAQMSGDWGVEAGLLAEVFRLCPAGSVCQIDVADQYEHKHRELSPDDPGKGLHKMAGDIVRQLFGSLALQGLTLDEKIFEALVAAYGVEVEAAVRFSVANAEVNNLAYNRREEELIASTFTESIRAAAGGHLSDPGNNSMIPAWSRVEAALPDFLPAFLELVQRENTSAAR